MEDLEIWTSDSSDDFGIVGPCILSDFAIDVQSKPIEFDRQASKKPPRAETVSVELILDKNEFSRLALTCPGYSLLTEDECSSVIIAKRDAQRLGLFHGSVVELKPISSADSEPLKKVKQAVALVADDGHSKTNLDTVEVKMLPVLWFNICPIPVNAVSGLKALQPRQCLLSRIQVASEAGCTASFAPVVKYANEVVVSCIKSPQYSVTASHDTLLKTYFAKPRLLQVGDVFGIHSAVDPQCFEPIPEGSEVRNPVVYFQVKTLRTSEKRLTSSCFVDHHHSQLLQESSVNGYIPSAMSYYFGAASCLSNWSQKLLPVFQDYIGSLSKIFQPFLTSRNHYGIYPIVLLSGPPGSGLRILTQILASLLSMHHYRLICSSLLSDTAAAAEAKTNQILQTVASCSPCVLHLDGVELVGKDRDGKDDSRVTSYFISTLRKIIDDSVEWPVIVIATSNSVAKISNDIYQCFLHCVKVEVLDEHRRLELLKSFLADEPLSIDVNLDHVAQRSAGMVLDDFIMLLSHVKQFAFRRLRAQSLSNADGGGSSHVAVQLTSNDFEMALNQMQLMHSEAIGAPKIPTVTWDDVGGLAKVKKDILDTIQLPLQHPELLNLGLRRSGVLLYGPPGTGKTLLAKAVATECSLNFLSVKGPELLNMYIGQSEENVRLVFERARSASPCVIFFDELDSLAPNRGRSGDSGGVMDRIVSQLLTELDGLHKSHSVFVIGATNRPDLLDPAMLRPGRFDKLVYVGISDDKASQLKILQALTRKFVLAPQCKLENVVERCPMSLTGADFYALASDAMLNTIRRRIEEIESGESELTDEEKLEVTESDFINALDNLVPSLSTADLQRYAALQKHYATPVTPIKPPT